MWTSAQIVAQACADARVPGWLQAGGRHLQAVLDELCQTYDFEGNKAFFNGTLNPSLVSTNPNFIAGNGPYALPTNYLRMRKQTFEYWFNGIPYPLVASDQYELDNQVQTIGIASLPRMYATDLSDPAVPAFYIYPPPNGAYPYEGRCTVLMPAIGSGTVAANGWNSGALAPESSPVIPWFPNTTYLRQRVAGELMKTTGDTRWKAILGKNGDGTGAQDILDRLLQAVDDKWNRAQRVMLDKRRFGKAGAYSRLPDTKNVFG